MSTPIVREQRFAVFGPSDITEVRSWNAYTLWVNEEWSGFRGWFVGVGDTRARRMADAIRKAKEAEGAKS